jgi:hypothetical protein
MKLPSFFQPRGGREQRLAPRIEVAYAASGNRGLAFNLSWRSIATRGGQKEALRVARAGGATHALVRAGQVGMGILPKRSRRPGARLLPAALVAARQHPGTAVCCIEVTPGEYWLALSIHGAPTSTDLFLSGISADQALQRALSLLEGLDDAQAGATLHTNIPGCTLPNARPYAPSDMLEAIVPESDVLRLVPRPTPVRGFLLGGLLLVAAILAWQQHRSRSDDASRAPSAAALPPAAPDLQSAWAAAVMRWAASVPMPRQGALEPARESLGGLPVHWHGWSLVQATCRASDLGPGAPDHRNWHCDAEYQRGPGALLNRDMAARAPAGWSLRFLPLGALQLHRTVRESASPLRPDELPTVSHFEVEVASRLQRLSPAFSGEVRLAFTPVPIAAPVDAAGQALPPPAESLVPLRAEFQWAGPLRSIDALLAEGVIAQWQAIHLTHQPSAAEGVIPMEPRASGSALMVDLKGVFLAKP